MATPTTNQVPYSASSSTSSCTSSIFLDFFDNTKPFGSTVGRDVFDACVLPYLSLDDLVNGSGVCRQMNEMCRTYTVGDVLDLLFPVTSQDLSDDHLVGIGNLVIGSCYMPVMSNNNNNNNYLPRSIHSRGKRPIVVDAGFLKRLHHPSVFPGIVSAIRAYFAWQGIEVAATEQPKLWERRGRSSVLSLSKTPSTASTANTADNTDSSAPPAPVLVSAKYGLARNNDEEEEDEDGGNCMAVDVTVILRHVLQQRQRLTLQDPGHGYPYWYCCLFGDPAPGRPKTLTIKTQTPDADGILRTRSQEFASEPKFAMPLRVAGNSQVVEEDMEDDDSLTDQEQNRRLEVLPPSHAVERGHNLHVLNANGEVERRRLRQQQQQQQQQQQPEERF